MVWWLAWFTNNGKQKKRFSFSTLFSLKLKFQFVLTSIQKDKEKQLYELVQPHSIQKRVRQKAKLENRIAIRRHILTQPFSIQTLEKMRNTVKCHLNRVKFAVLPVISQSLRGFGFTHSFVISDYHCFTICLYENVLVLYCYLSSCPPCIMHSQEPCLV